MADTLNPVMSVVATTASQLPSLPIKDGQLIFIKDRQKIALDFNSKRNFYNQIILLQTDSERTGLLAPVSELFYFVIETAVLWTYSDGWIQITSRPQEIVHIGVTLPELGSADTLYVDKTKKCLSIWDDDENAYIDVADKTEAISESDILNLFK